MSVRAVQVAVAFIGAHGALQVFEGEGVLGALLAQVAAMDIIHVWSYDSHDRLQEQVRVHFVLCGHVQLGELIKSRF
jgi:hypothetical protein